VDEGEEVGEEEGEGVREGEHTYIRLYICMHPSARKYRYVNTYECMYVYACMRVLWSIFTVHPYISCAFF
jgi:hypothetical protein